MTHGLVLYVNSPPPSLNSLVQIFWTIFSIWGRVWLFFLMNGDGVLFFFLFLCFLCLLYSQVCFWVARSATGAANTINETLGGEKIEKRKMPSTSMWMFCACSSAHHKCDVTIALDSCTSNKKWKQKSKNWTVRFSFVEILGYYIFDSLDLDTFLKRQLVHF